MRRRNTCNDLPVYYAMILARSPLLRILRCASANGLHYLLNFVVFAVVLFQVPSATGQNTNVSARIFAPYESRMRNLIREDQQMRDEKQLQSDQRLLRAIENFVAFDFMSENSGPNSSLKYASIDGPGVTESDVLRVNTLVWLQALWQAGPKPQAAIADYVANRERTEDFGNQLHAVMIADPVLSQWDGQITDRASRVRAAIRDKDAVMARDFTPEERADLLRTNDVPGKYHRLDEAVQEMFASLNRNDSAAQSAWSSLQQFIKHDIDSGLFDATGAEKRDFSTDISDAAWHAGDTPPEAIDRAYKQLSTSAERVKEMRAKAQQRVLFPYETPMAALRDPSLRDLMEAMVEYQDAVVDALNLPEMKGQWAFALGNMLFNMVTPLEDAVDIRAAGQYLLAIRALERTMANFVRGEHWDNYDIFSDAPAISTVGYFDRYQDALLQGSGTPPTLWGAVDILPSGALDWRVGGWMEWRWLNSDDYQTLSSENRLIEFLKVQWLLPVGVSGSSIRSGPDLLTDHAKYVLVALDKSGLMPFALEDHWVAYLKAVQSEAEYSNWSAPPYDLYIRHSMPVSPPPATALRDPSTVAPHTATRPPQPRQIAPEPAPEFLAKALDDEEFYQEACRDDSVESCIDYDSDHYQKACEAGDAAACVNYGNQLYGNDEGGLKGTKQAANLFRKACDAGSPIGCFNLGVDYLQGSGLSQDTARAAHFFQVACDGADILGCNELGILYANGGGVTKDRKRAAQLFQKACDAAAAMPHLHLGDNSACYNLGLLYESGKGVEKDTERALQLYQQACGMGQRAACKASDRLKASN